MLRKMITYEDLDGKEAVEVYYFNYTSAELAEQVLEFGGSGEDLAARLREIVESGDSRKVIATFKKILLDSVGKRSVDGKLFIKNEQIQNEFVQSGAYSALFMELVTNASTASEFIKAILPANLAKNLPDNLTDNLRSSLPTPLVTVNLPETDIVDVDTRPIWVIENRKPTEDEIFRMTEEEMRETLKHIAPTNG